MPHVFLVRNLLGGSKQSNWEARAGIPICKNEAKTSFFRQQKLTYQRKAPIEKTNKPTTF